jgi:hypothetical protein
VNKNYKTSSNRADSNFSQEDLDFEKEVEKAAILQYRNFYGRGEFRYGIFPSYWKDSWGRAPLLGIVFADNEFLAEKLAYDRGYLPSPCNCTFRPKIKNLGPIRKSSFQAQTN